MAPKWVFRDPTGSFRILLDSMGFLLKEYFGIYLTTLWIFRGPAGFTRIVGIFMESQELKKILLVDTRC